MANTLNNYFTNIAQIAQILSNKIPPSNCSFNKYLNPPFPVLLELLPPLQQNLLLLITPPNPPIVSLPVLMILIPKLSLSSSLILFQY